MKKTWSKPQLTVYGNVEEVTQVRKTFGSADGVILAIPNGPDIPIGSV